MSSVYLQQVRNSGRKKTKQVVPIVPFNAFLSAPNANPVTLEEPERLTPSGRSYCGNQFFPILFDTVSYLSWKSTSKPGCYKASFQY